MTRFPRTIFALVCFHQPLPGGGKQLPTYAASFLCWAFLLGSCAGFPVATLEHVIWNCLADTPPRLN